MSANAEIRAAIKAKKLKQFQVAEAYGVATSYFSYLLQRELPKQRKEEILRVISEM